MDVNNAKQLARVLEGRDDREIIATVIDIGIEVALAKVFDGMTRAFLPEQAGAHSAVIQWNVTVGGATYAYQLHVANGVCRAVKGGRRKAHLTLTAELPSFLRVITGRTNSRWAVVTGQLRIAGDVGFALTQERWFDKDWAG